MLVVVIACGDGSALQLSIGYATFGLRLALKAIATMFKAGPTRVGGGGVIDLTMHVLRLSFVNAVKRLSVRAGSDGHCRS